MFIKSKRWELLIEHPQISIPLWLSQQETDVLGGWGSAAYQFLAALVVCRSGGPVNTHDNCDAKERNPNEKPGKPILHHRNSIPFAPLFAGGRFSEQPSTTPAHNHLI